MGDEPTVDVVSACATYIGAQRHLLAVMQAQGEDIALVTAMSAQLDLLAAALRDARAQNPLRPRSDPGE